jgi:hypothetical protein
LSQSEYLTYSLTNAANASYSNGLRATLRIRIYRGTTNVAAPAGFGDATATSLSLCLSLAPTTALAHTALISVDKSAICFFNSIIAHSAQADKKLNGFKIAAHTNFQSLALVKPLLLASTSQTLVDTTTPFAPASASVENISIAKSATDKTNGRYDISFSGGTAS